MILPQFVEEIGLNKYEKEIVLFLSSVNSATANQIYKKTKVPQGRIYSVLNELKQKRLIEIIQTSPKKYQIKDIKEALKNYLNQKKEEIEETINRAEEIEAKPRRFLEEKEVFARMIIGREEHIEVLSGLREKAKKELLQMAPTFGPSFASDISLERALFRGVKVKIIVKQITPVNKNRIKNVIKNGAEVRRLNADILSLNIVDYSEFLVSVHKREEEERVAILGRNKALLDALENTFQESWKKAKPIRLKDIR